MGLRAIIVDQLKPYADMEKIWVTDEELIKQAEERGVPASNMKVILKGADADRLSGFPRKNPMYGNRRYWPNVLKYWEVINPFVPPKRVHQNDAA